jgi:HD-like signal output (HDOD) protein
MTSPQHGVESIAERMLHLFGSPSYRPPTLPQVALQLLKVARDDHMSISRIVSVLEQDPVLTGRVLRLVQSPLYAGMTPVKSLQQAVVRLGLSTLRDAVMEVALNTSVFRCNEYRDRMQAVQLHSRASAYIARTTCEYTGLESEYAFLCGLLHDVGFAGILIALADDNESGVTTNVTPLWSSLNAIHESTGGLMARIWDLPTEVLWVISRHHAILEEEGEILPMIATMEISEEIAEKLGFALQVGGRVLADGPTERSQHRRRARRILGLNDAQVLQIKQKAMTVINGLH